MLFIGNNFTLDVDRGGLRSSLGIFLEEEFVCEWCWLFAISAYDSVRFDSEGNLEYVGLLIDGNSEVFRGKNDFLFIWDFTSATVTLCVVAIFLIFCSFFQTGPFLCIGRWFS